MDGERTFHKDANAAYCLPNDSPEHRRLELQAKHLASIMKNQVLHSPICEDAKRLLDIGCGTGYVTETLALHFPTADVFGLDLSPVPKLRASRPNVHYLQGNVLADSPASWRSEDDHEVTIDDGTFDLTFSRCLIGGMNEWPNFLKKEYSLLKPGGWAEVHELDIVTYNADGQSIADEWNWSKVVQRACAERGLDIYGAQKVAAWMASEAGFVNIQTKEYPLQLGGEGEKTLELQQAGEFFGMSFPKIMEMVINLNVVVGRDVQTTEEKLQLIEDMQRDQAPAPGKHMKMIVTFGQKPD